MDDFANLSAGEPAWYHLPVKEEMAEEPVRLHEGVFTTRRGRLNYLVAALLALTAVSLTADELTLKNGDFITGHIISMDEDKVVIRTTYGELEIDRSQVATGSFFSADPLPDDALDVELLFDGDPVIPDGSYMTVAEYGVQPSAGADGTPNSSVRSTGGGTFIEISGTPAFDSAGDVTLSFWVFPRESTRLQYFLSKWDTAKDGGIGGKVAVGTRYSALYVYLMDRDGEYHLESFEEMVPPGTWTHIAVVFDAGRLTVYQNGEFTGERELAFTALNQSASPLYVLTARAATDDPWSYYNLDGMMDNLRIYSRVLTESEITELAEEL